MKMEPLKGGCLKIWMSGTDMHRWGLRFECMSAEDTATRRAIHRLIHIARQREALRANDGLTVEALPADEGCLLLFTPQRSFVPLRSPKPIIYALHNGDDLLELGDRLCRWDPRVLPAAALYGWGQGYRLIVYADPTPVPTLHRLLSEYAQPVAAGYAAAAYTEEHGTPLIPTQALQRLTARESPEPTPPVEPH